MSHTHAQPSESAATKQSWQMPDTLILIFFVGIFAAILTYLIPAGHFDSQQVSYVVDGAEKTRTVIDPSSFSYATDENGELVYNKVGLFASGGGIGLMNFPFEGLVSGSKWGSAIGVIMFMLVIGGAFGVVMRTGTIDNGILRLIDKTKGNEALFIPVLFLLFSLGGAVFGMGEEAVAFAIIIAPLMVRLGYDGITTVMVTYVATQIGFATSWMNPFSVAIAQGIAGIPVLSGMTVRMALWVGFTLIGIAFTMVYASRIKANPEYSYSRRTDKYFRQQELGSHDSRWNFGDTLVILTVIATTTWVVWGVVAKAWYIPEIASQFFTMGFVVAIIGTIFRLNGMTLNCAADAFKEGAAIMLAPALLVGCAKGVLLILGGGTTDEASVLNSILNSAGGVISGLPDVAAAWLMYVFQSIFNFFVTSGSGQAALTMPLLSPLADIAGVTRQVAVLAFQLGDGFTNVIVPTSASLMATLGVCRIDWGDWAKFCWRFMLLLFTLSSIVVVAAHVMGFA
ncbi:putative basic amino acid antiporter YfcC [Vibrio parahaemolyticus]|uniref:putative basic amino acid antiporter YfcC n=1 Tax=Vibrio parahaemolyticus TaxID=670 RepID=UPI00111EE8D4|nr:putative basic amino acid antiporter YfcC [Vibrio parahaemolyticus]EGS6497110.1 putative basic amino acid antiporter YfcC [Vibrio parahaemolyticus]EJE4165468.1 putative basic amino acid antiporter YfcC [Vibrio parahaemolyticus]ELA9303320.1 putative basic amino acid antiporter YfcC [Vibrio parahaemolyticus]ELF4876565.1 putative basic amino acid antiporter YfcC [Vibrio parahaemolyticus]MBM4951358.1 putative basic amino acid antiporter YfcC [Vibrio parahaemolyticus]